MPNQSQIFAETNFINGVVTEATAVNFPDKAVKEAFDCIFDYDGSVYRRTGFNFEDNFTTKTIDRSNCAIKTYLWQNVSGNGDVAVVVAQIGATIYFWETNGSGIFSTGAQSTTITLTSVAGAPTPEAVEAQFCDGNGYLFITHPFCEPIRVAYDASTHTATPTNIILKIRDFEGAVTDPNSVTNRPTETLGSANQPHLYNLYNQGWTTTNLTAWDTAQTTLPSNADVMWQFKNTTNDFDATTASIARVTAGNSPAPNGHFILTLSNQDRVAAAGLTPGTVPSTTTSFQRPSNCAFFSGRVFYSGINFVGFNSNIYFTQIIENVSQYGACYQVNDPTAEDLFDLLPSDGGVIALPEAGTIYKMFTIPGGLCIFAANGVWFLTGSTGLGFTATDYALLKVADIPSISDASFVNVGGFPAWWNSEGIYIMQSAQQAMPQVQSLTFNTYKTGFDEIPVSSKRYARGFYDKTDGIIRWVYRSTPTDDLNSIYEYDRVLNFNTRTNAFYPWTITQGGVKVHAILSTELVTRPVTVNNVIDNSANNVVDSFGNQVIAFAASGNQDQQFDKYLVSYVDSGNTKFTFANRSLDKYKDWIAYDSFGSVYDSYFITGFKLPGQGIRKAQNTWVQVYSRLDTPVRYHFQALWDFADTGDTGRWSSNQLVTHTDTNYNNDTRRLKVRGHGKVMQFKVSSVGTDPFDCIGWSSSQNINGVP